MRKALITGITGQDGTYLAESLVSRGYKVFGVVRSSDQAGLGLPKALASTIELLEVDLLDDQAVNAVVANCKPDEIYNFAAYTSGAEMFRHPVTIGDVNGLSVARLLEAVRNHSPACRFLQASSREIFGDAEESPQTETTRVNPRSPYGAAKAYADSMVRIYRQQYGLFACSAILFNHESPRRSEHFVSRKISIGVARIKLGLSEELRLGNLDVVRDWGFAVDYVEAMRRMLQQPVADDFIIATGQGHTVRDFCEVAFEKVGLDYRTYVKSDPRLHRLEERYPLIGDATKAMRCLDWQPSTSFRDLVSIMVEEDLRRFQYQSL